MKKEGFRDQVAVVTGASSGIGRALYTNKIVSTGRCVDIILEAASRRKRVVVMGTGR